MKIAVPVNEDNAYTMVAPSFGRAPYFLVLDSETEKIEYLTNKAAAQKHEQSEGSARTILDHGIGVLLTPQCNNNDADILNSTDGFEIFQTNDDSALHNIVDYFQGDLPLFDDFGGIVEEIEKKTEVHGPAADTSNRHFRGEPYSAGSVSSHCHHGL